MSLCFVSHTVADRALYNQQVLTVKAWRISAADDALTPHAVTIVTIRTAAALWTPVHHHALDVTEAWVRITYTCV